MSFQNIISVSRSRAAVCVVAVTLAFPVGLGAQEKQQEQKEELPRYIVQDLGTLGGTFSLAGGINNKGDVEGEANYSGDTVTHAFLWRNGIMTDLGTLGGLNSAAIARPSERGQVGGQAESTSPDPNGENNCGNHLMCLPFVWQEGAMTPLPTLGGNNGRADGFNNLGQVVGEAENTTKDPTCVAPQVLQFKPVTWHKDWDNDDVQELPTILGDPDGSANGVNDEGQATGASGNCSAPFHAVLWQRGEVESQNDDGRVHWTATDLGSLGGTMNNIGTDINNQGQVVGFSDLTGDKTSHAFLWQDGVMRDLGTLPGDIFSTADGINDEGQVVGGSYDINGHGRAFLWQNGVMTDLNTRIPLDSPLTLLEATGTINSRGQIAGIALQQSTGQVHAFLATPCDENHAENEGCRDVAEGATATRGETSERPKMALPENVRQRLQQQLNRRYHIHAFGAGPAE